MAVVKRVMPKTGKKKVTADMDGPVIPGELSLPTELSEPAGRIEDFIILVHGQPKIGKTSLTAQADATIHLMTEPGAKSLRIFQRSIPNWRTFIGYVKLLEKDRRFKHVTVDVADVLYRQCFDATMQKLGIGHPAEESYGKGWAAIRDEFTRWISRLANTKKGVTFITHSQEREIKTRGGGTYDRITPQLSGQAREVLEALADLILYYHFDDEGRRVLTIVGDDHVTAGHRLAENFRYTDGSPVKEIPMGHSAKEAYDQLMRAFHNKLPRPATSTPEDAAKLPTKKSVVKKRVK